MTLLNQNSSKQTANGAGNGRRKTKGSHFTQKKNRPPRRGMSVAKLEQLRLQPEFPQNHQNCQIQSYNPSLGFAISGSPNAAVQYFRPVHVSAPNPAVQFQTIGTHGGGVYCADYGSDPVIGSSFGIENPREVASVASYVKCGSDSCVACHKKKRINGGVNPYRNFGGNNMEMIDAGKARRHSGQVAEGMSIGRISMTEYEFFPGKGGGAEECNKMMRMGSWCGSGGSVAGGIGLRGGDGSCVTVMTGGEEGSVSSVDLSLKL